MSQWIDNDLEASPSRSMDSDKNITVHRLDNC